MNDPKLKGLIDHYIVCKKQLDDASEAIWHYLNYEYNDINDDSNDPNLLINNKPSSQMVVTTSKGGLPLMCNNCGGNLFSWDGKLLRCDCGTPKCVEENDKFYVSWRAD